MRIECLGITWANALACVRKQMSRACVSFSIAVLILRRSQTRLCWCVELCPFFFSFFHSSFPSLLFHISIEVVFTFVFHPFVSGERESSIMSVPFIHRPWNSMQCEVCFLKLRWIGHKPQGSSSYVRWMRGTLVWVNSLSPSLSLFSFFHSTHVYHIILFIYNLHFWGPPFHKTLIFQSESP